jgi:hypothetical protein
MDSKLEKIKESYDEILVDDEDNEAISLKRKTVLKS